MSNEQRCIDCFESLNHAYNQLIGELGELEDRLNEIYSAGGDNCAALDFEARSEMMRLERRHNYLKYGVLVRMETQLENYPK